MHFVQILIKVSFHPSPFHYTYLSVISTSNSYPCLVILLVVKRKLWALLLPRFHSKHGRDTSLSIHVFVNKYCFPLNFSFYISFLDCLSRPLSYRFGGCCFQSYMNITCRSTQNAACMYQMNMVLEKWNADENDSATSSYSFSFKRIQQLTLQVWSLAKFRSGLAERPD